MPRSIRLQDFENIFWLNSMQKNKFIFLLILITTISSYGKDRAVTLVDKNVFYEINTHLDILEDPTKKLTIRDITLPEWDSKFKRNKKKTIFYGFSKSNYWIRFELKNQSKKNSWLIYQRFPLLENLVFFKKVNEKWESISTGVMKPFHTREIKDKGFIFKVPNKKKSIYYFKVNSTVSGIDLTITTSNRLIQERSKDNLIRGLFFGLIISIFLSNIFIFISTRSLGNLYYSLYVFFVGIFLFIIAGFSQRFLIPNSVWISKEGILFSFGLAGIFFNLFTVHYLGLKENNPNIYKGCLFFIFLGFLLAIGSLIFRQEINIKVLYFTVTIFTPFILFVAIYKFKMNNRPSIFYLLSILVLLLGFFIYNLPFLKILPVNFFTLNTIYFGNALELIFLSMGVADKFNYQQKIALRKEKLLLDKLEIEKYQVEEEIRISGIMYKRVQEANETLEAKVLERTDNLNKKALELVNKNKEISDEKNNVSTILDNMLQAVFAVEDNGNIVSPVSKYCKNIFEKVIIGKNVFDILFKDISKDSEDYSRINFGILSSVGVNKLQFFCSEGTLPKKIKYINSRSEEMTLRISYSSIVNELDITTKILFVVENISEIENLEKINKTKEKENILRMRKLQEIASNKKVDIINFKIEFFKNINICTEAIKSVNINNFNRCFHTLKGLARFYGFNQLSSDIHLLENELKEIKSFKTNKADLQDCLESLLLQLKTDVNIYLDLANEIFNIDLLSKNEENEQYLEIPSNLIKSRIKETNSFLKKMGNDELAERLNEMLKVNFNLTCSSFSKIIKNLERLLNKKIDLKISGDQIYLERDQNVILKECLTHIIQNSMDHGIESKGVISIRLSRLKDKIAIVVSDNGRGIDHNKVKVKALEKGLISEKGSENLNKNELLNLIFRSDFSTKESVSEYSGRGVGMDVVYNNIKKLNGEIAISSEVSKGTEFKIKIPA